MASTRYEVPRLNTGITVQDVLDANRGVGPGFHFLRYALAALIFAFHSYYVLKGQVGAVGYGDLLTSAATAPSNASGSPLVEYFRPALFALVACFFALSGFLVTGSAYRVRNVRVFLGFRVLRIVPALAVETLLSAAILGPLVTSAPLADYFRDPLLWRYLGNIVGFVSFELPGVFGDNDVQAIVNVNLWTLPGEFYCYLIMSILMAMGIAYRRASWVLLIALSTAAFLLAVMLMELPTRSNTTHFTTPMIVYYFFAGCLFFELRDKIPLRMDIFLLSAATYYVVTLFKLGDLISPFFLTYCVIFLGCQSYVLFDKLMPGDYSYGIYLYGFPIQQAIVYFAPGIRNPLVMFVAAGAVTLLFAICSWYLIEKPALKLKPLVAGGSRKAIPGGGSASASPV